MLSERHRRVAVRVRCVHQVDTRKILIRRHDVYGVLPGNPHEVRKSGTRGHEDTFEAGVFQLGDCQCLPDDTVFHKTDSELSQVINLKIDDTVRQTELGDAILQDTADFVQSLEDRHVITALRHISGERKSGRSGPYDGHFVTIGRGFDGCRMFAMLAVVIGGEAFKIADGHSLSARFQVDAVRLALLLLRTDTSAHSGQRAGLFKRGGGLAELAPLDILDETRDIDAHRASFDASRVRTVQTTPGLPLCLCHGQSTVHFFFQATRPVGRR